MRDGARAAAAIEVLADIEARKRPASEALKDWGLAHRFAGSGDRAAIGNLVFDALRKRASSAYAMGDDSPRALVLRTLVSSWGMTPEQVAALADGSKHAPEPLADAELAGLARDVPQDAPPPVRGDFPEWLARDFARAFGERAAEEGAALAQRAPVDLRANTLKATREKVLKALARFEAEPTPHSPLGLRLPEGFQVEPSDAWRSGLVEVQDEGSQLISLGCAAGPGMNVVDLCAGAGGKTLALGAEMAGQGRILACDTDRARLSRMAPRLDRAGVANVDARLLDPGRETAQLADVAGAADLVLVDAPCSGTGTWRRNPETRWRITPERLSRLTALQARLLDLAAELLRPGGHLVYAVCSVLAEEGRDQAEALAGRSSLVSAAPAIAAGRPAGSGILLSPAWDGTDGFFVARWRRPC